MSDTDRLLLLALWAAGLGAWLTLIVWLAR